MFPQQQNLHRIDFPRNITPPHMDLSHTALSPMVLSSSDMSSSLPNSSLINLHATVISDSNEVTIPCKHNDYSSREFSALTYSQSIPLQPSLLDPPLNSLDNNTIAPLTNITPIPPSSENTPNAETNFYQ